MRTEIKGNKKQLRMLFTNRIIIGSLLLAGTAAAFTLSMQSNSESTTRRNFISKTAGAATIASVALPKVVIADDPYDNYITTESGMKYLITRQGAEDAAIPQQGQTVKAHYTGWLDGFNSDKKFDSSRDRGKPFTFKVGAGQVIRGWDEAFSTMRVGEKRNIVLPPRLAYGDRGAGGIIPGGATLFFDVELLSIL